MKDKFFDLRAILLWRKPKYKSVRENLLHRLLVWLGFCNANIAHILETKSPVCTLEHI